MVIQLRQGESLLIEFMGSEDRFKVEYDKDSIAVTAESEDDKGRKCVIWEAEVEAASTHRVTPPEEPGELFRLEPVLKSLHPEERSKEAQHRKVKPYGATQITGGYSCIKQEGHGGDHQNRQGQKWKKFRGPYGRQ